MKKIISKYSLLNKTRIMENGMACTVIQDKGSKDILVKFEDGYERKSNRYNFNRGKIDNPYFRKGNILGKTDVMSCGMACTVIQDKGSRDITVKFEDGTIVEHIRRSYFIEKSISNPSLGQRFSHIYKSSIQGESKIMKSGIKCTVIKDNGKEKLTVKFEDGTIKENCSRDSFRKGSIIHPLLGRGYAYSKKHSILGKEKLMKCGMKCVVIKDNGSSNISVKFEDGIIVNHKLRYAFEHREIVNPNLINVSSLPQRIIFNFIHDFFNDAVQNYRPEWMKNKLTNANMELDIWIPSIKIGIEYDGVQWHKKENERSKIKAEIIQQNENIKSLITILEKGAIKHTSNKHINFLLNTTSNRSEKEAFILDLEKTINNVLKYLGVNEEVKITQDILEKVYCADTINAYSRTLIRGKNDLETLRSDLAKEWDFQKNKFLPSDITCGSGKKVFWICSKCGYKWNTTIQRRARYGTGCPECARDIHKIRVMNLDNGKIYKSLTNAAHDTGTKKEKIVECCKGLRETAAGFHWKYIDK